MLGRWIVRLLMVVPATVAAVLLASSGSTLPYEARMLAGAVTFAAVVTARDHVRAALFGGACVALAGIVALIARA